MFRYHTTYKSEKEQINTIKNINSETIQIVNEFIKNQDIYSAIQFIDSQIKRINQYVKDNDDPSIVEFSNRYITEVQIKLTDMKNILMSVSNDDILWNSFLICLEYNNSYWILRFIIDNYFEQFLKLCINNGQKLILTIRNGLFEINNKEDFESIIIYVIDNIERFSYIIYKNKIDLCGFFRNIEIYMGSKIKYYIYRDYKHKNIYEQIFYLLDSYDTFYNIYNENKKNHMCSVMNYTYLHKDIVNLILNNLD